MSLNDCIGVMVYRPLLRAASRFPLGWLVLGYGLGTTCLFAWPKKYVCVGCVKGDVGNGF